MTVITQQSLRALSHCSIALLYCTALLLPLVGCGKSGPQMGKVSGKVAFSDGSIPQGAATVIRFEPVADTNAEVRKVASGHIEEDGSYELFTIRPGDGVFFGQYKAVFTVLESYRSGRSMVEKKFTDSATSPFDCVVDSANHEYDFELVKAR